MENEVASGNEKLTQGFPFKGVELSPAPCPVAPGVLLPQMVRDAAPKYDGCFKAVDEGISIVYASLFGKREKEAGLLKCAPGNAGLTFHCFSPLSLASLREALPARENR